MQFIFKILTINSISNTYLSMAKKVKRIAKKSQNFFGVDRVVLLVSFTIIGLLVGLIAINNPLTTSNEAATRRGCWERCNAGSATERCASGLRCRQGKCQGTICGPEPVPTAEKLPGVPYGFCQMGCTTTHGSDNCEPGLVCVPSGSDSDPMTNLWRCKCPGYGPNQFHEKCRQTVAESCKNDGVKCTQFECPPWLTDEARRECMRNAPVECGGKP